MKKCFFIIVLLVFEIGCTNSIIIKKYSKNPTQYTFNTSINKIKTVIIEKFDLYKFKNCYPIGEFSDHIHMRPILISEYDLNNLTLFLSDSIINTLSKNDAVLTSSFDCVGNSSVYFLGNKGAIYFATFIIRLREIDNNQTRVEIETYNPRIYAGGRFWDFVFISHPAPANHKKVEPTTIEEYEILLTIGEALGVKENMPKMNLPEK